MTASASGSAHSANTVHRVRLHDAAPQPWRNGGGITRELLAWALQGHARGSDAAAAWTLRVSVADIARDGPFSAFPGVDRCFAVLEGQGVVLTLDGSEHSLTPTEPPLRFDGALAPGCRLIDGPTRDLNLMVQQRDGSAAMAAALPGTAWTHSGPWRGLYTHGPATVDFGEGPEPLEAGTLCWQEGAHESRRKTSTDAWTLCSGGPAWWMGLAPQEQST